MAYALGAIVLALAVGLLWWRARLRKSGYLAAIEYWVYLPEAKLPKQEALMTRMISENPYKRPGRAPIGAREGMVFSDIRLHLGLATRAKNPHMFRPDLLAEAAEPTRETLQALTKAQAVARARYISETQLADDRHLQFMPQMAGALLGLADGLAVYDPVRERLWTADEFDAELGQSPNCARIDLHLSVIEREDEKGRWVETRGLRKVGHPELRAGPLDGDQTALTRSLLDEAAGRLWNTPDLPASLEIAAFGDTFELRVGPRRDGFAQVELGRVRPKPAP